MLGYVGVLAETLTRLADVVDVLAGYAIKPAPRDRLAVEVLPHTMPDRLLLNS